MTGVILQFMMLVAWGNEFLKGKALPANFYPENSGFKFCHRIYFTDLTHKDPTKDAEGDDLASNPVAWFHYLKQQHCKELKLFFQYSKAQNPPDYKTAGMIGGGGYWRIEANYESRCEIWASRWETTKQSGDENAIWSVQYGLLDKEATPTQLPSDLAIIKKVTGERLTAVRQFARKQGLREYEKQFKKAFKALRKKHPERRHYLAAMLPLNEYPLIVRQLLVAAATAWVFGGQGSWNDLGFSDENTQRQYEQLSYGVYDAICVDIISGMNAQ